MEPTTPTPTPPANERYWPTGDWRDQRELMRRVYEAKGQKLPANLPDGEWEFFKLIMEKHREVLDALTNPKCASCEKRIYSITEVIRCLDCKAPFCETCAPRHFWPNGRPASHPIR